MNSENKYDVKTSIWNGSSWTTSSLENNVCVNINNLSLKLNAIDNIVASWESLEETCFRVNSAIWTQ